MCEELKYILIIETRDITRHTGSLIITLMASRLGVTLNPLVITDASAHGLRCPLDPVDAGALIGRALAHAVRLAHADRPDLGLSLSSSSSLDGVRLLAGAVRTGLGGVT